MFRRTTRVVLPMVLALVVVGGLPASAKAPTKEVYRDEGWFTLPDIACDGFTLTEEMDSEYVRVTTWFDEAGTPIKESIKANFFGTITNSVSGNTYRDHSTFTETYDLVKGTTTVSGQSYHYIVKGQGQVFAEVGHKIFVTGTDPPEILHQGGQDDYVNDPDLLGLCEYLV
jgi:hypothetical protein